MKVVHLTSAHPRFDTRIFIKQCGSLAAEGFDVSLVVADGKGDESKGDVSIFDVGRERGRFRRFLRSTKKVYKKASDLNGDIYHLHDPELIPTGLKLLRKGKKVIFDSHEDFPKQILSKPYLPTIIAKVLSYFISKFERVTLPKFSGVVTATPYIRDKLLKINPNTIDVNNYPKIEELYVENIDWAKKEKSICYVGGISKVRGVKEIVQAMESTKGEISLQLAGNFNEMYLRDEIADLPGWSQVNELGFLDRKNINLTLRACQAGLVTLHPIVNYLDALPVKMFEYMCAGIPVISSDFPLWRKIVEENKCGICVDPLNPKEIGEAIDYIIANPKEAEEMGKNGQRAVLSKYNWGTEQASLIDFYKNKLC